MVSELVVQHPVFLRTKTLQFEVGQDLTWDCSYPAGCIDCIIETAIIGGTTYHSYDCSGVFFFDKCVLTEEASNCNANKKEYDCGIKVRYTDSSCSLGGISLGESCSSFGCN